VYPLLNGIRILDLGRLINADFATQQLADLGADVIKVEGPPAGDYLRGLPPAHANGVGAPYIALNKNKRSLYLNVKVPAGRQVFLDLLKTSDAVVQTSKPGTFARLQLDYESLAAVKPDLVYVEISAFGQTGPWRQMPAHGYNMLATTNRIAFEWAGGRPEFSPAGPAKQGGGGMGAGSTAALATLAALVQRSLTGQGQYVDVSLWDELVSVETGFRDYLNGTPPMMETLDLRHAPRYNLYATLDEKVIFLGPIERHFWSNFCNAVGRPEWIPRARFETSMDHGNYDTELRDLIQAEVRKRTQAEWLEIFLAQDVPASPVLDTHADLEATPHFQERRMAVEFEHESYGRFRTVRPGFRIPEAEFKVRYAAPTLGEHSEAILGELGYDQARLADLRAAGAI
jgi:formyl-CoA transferase